MHTDGHFRQQHLVAVLSGKCSSNQETSVSELSGLRHTFGSDIVDASVFVKHLSFYIQLNKGGRMDGLHDRSSTVD